MYKTHCTSSDTKDIFDPIVVSDKPPVSSMSSIRIWLKIVRLGSLFLVKG